MEAQPHPAPPQPSTLEARANAVEQLCDGFSHDTRNPLNAMVIHLEVLGDKLRREHQGQVPYGLEKNLKAIKDQVGRIDEMVRRFVELAAPRRQHELEFDASALVRSVVEQSLHHARLARADIRNEGATGLKLRGSASEFGVALALLLHGQVDGGAKRLAVRTDAEGGQVVVRIEGTVDAPNASEELRRAVDRMDGTVHDAAGSIEVRIPTARAEPTLRVLSGSEDRS